MKPKNAALESETIEAFTGWCYDEGWKALDKELPMGVRNRLAIIDRSVYAANAIARMLVTDARGKADARDDNRVIYKGLNNGEVTALQLALLELGDRAEERLEEVRDDMHGCWQSGRARA